MKLYQFMVRDADWLTADRVAAVTQIMLLVFIGLVISIPWSVPTMQVGDDFGAFWTAAKFALNGHAAEAYGDAGRDAIATLFGPGHIRHSSTHRMRCLSGCPSPSRHSRWRQHFGSL